MLKVFALSGLIIAGVARDEEFVSSCYDSLFDISANLIGGEQVLIGDVCKGKKSILVVNVATE